MTGFPGLIPIPIQTLPEFIICDTSTNTWSPTTSMWPSPSAWPLTSAPAARRGTGVAIDDDFPIIEAAPF